jgi:hypothetical protein
MTLQDVGGVGELIGGIGVIVSLLYLARQIRDSSRIERLNARFAVSQALLSAFSRIDEDPELHRVWVTARDRGEELDEEDRERLGRFLYQYFVQLSLAYGYSEIDPEIRARYEPNLVRFLQAAEVRSWWSRQREFFAAPFRSEADLLLTTLEPQ